MFTNNLEFRIHELQTPVILMVCHEMTDTLHINLESCMMKYRVSEYK